MNIPRELPQLYSSGRILPFVGAGVSRSVGWTSEDQHYQGPSWGELVDQAAKQLGFEKPELIRARGTDLQVLEYFKLVKEGIAPLANWLLLNMQAPDDAIRESPVLNALAALKLCPLYYTTNYDNFLERALALAGRAPSTVSSETHIGGTTSRQPQVVKFHGDLDNPDRMVVTESDYERRLAFSTAMDFRLRADVLGRVVLFLGYSFRDPNVAYLFRLVNEHLDKLTVNPTGRRAYIVVADPSDFETRLYRARNIEVIGIDGGALADETAAVLRGLMGD